VKPVSADGTATPGGRVGRRLPQGPSQTVKGLFCLYTPPVDYFPFMQLLLIQVTIFLFPVLQILSIYCLVYIKTIAFLFNINF
uniref:hypothetical protein n=1 Tax=Flagellimonas baculiformis TaxID=3067310 RepID=UPI00296E8F4B